MPRGPERPPRLTRSGPGRAAAASFITTGSDAASLLPPLATGILLGQAREMADVESGAQQAPREPLRLELFGSRPRDIVVLGHPDLGRLLALRAAACGAALAVAAAVAAPWRALFEVVGAQPGLATLVQAPVPVLPQAAPDQPLLLVMDGMPPGPSVVPPGRHSTLWVGEESTVEDLQPVLARADVMILGQGHADVVTRGLELAGAAPRVGTMMSALDPDEVLITSSQAAVRRAWITPSAVEYQLLAPAGTGIGAPSGSGPPLPSPPR